MRSNGFPTAAAGSVGASTTRRVLAALAGTRPATRRQWAIGYALAPVVLAAASLGVDGPDGLTRLTDLAHTTATTLATLGGVLR